MDYRTTNEIRNDFLDHMENDLSKMEGTYNFDIASSVGYVVNKLYVWMDFWSKQAFIDTATEDIYIEKHAATFGLTRRAAGKAAGIVQITGKAGTTIALGTVVLSKTGIKYATTNDLLLDSKGTGEVQIEALVGGTQGNCSEGDIVSFEIYNTNLYTVTNTDSIIDGYDTESNEALVNRVIEKARQPAHSGNRYDYMQWAKEVSGVGKSECISCWNGPGTVKVLISDYYSQAASPELCKKVKEYIEEERPIGADVTVESFAIQPVNMDIKVLLQAGYELNDVTDNIKIDLQVANNKDKLIRTIGTTKTISIGLINEVIIHVDGVKDCEISNLSLTTVPTNTLIQIGNINVSEF